MSDVTYRSPSSMRSRLQYSWADDAYPYALLAAVAGPSLPLAPAPDNEVTLMPKGETPDTTFVLVHGAYHSGGCWGRLAPHLRGMTVALDLPGRGSRPMDLRRVTLDAWREAIVEEVDQASTEKVILVGHSLGGVLLSAVASLRPERVTRLVFLSGVMPPDGGTQRANMAWLGRVGTRLQTHDGVLRPPPRWLAGAMFCNGMTRALSDWTLHGLVPEAAAVFDEPVSRGGSAAAHATYVRLTKDRAVPPRMANQQIVNFGRPMDVAELEAGHDAMISHPERLATILNRCVSAN